MSYEYLHHTADAKILVNSSTLPLAFSDLATALCKLIVDEQVSELIDHSFSCRAKSLDMLTYSFVDEWIQAVEIEGLLGSIAKVSVKQLDGFWVLEGTFVGDKVSNYSTHGNVKAPTLHDLFASSANGAVQLKITVDL